MPASSSAPSPASRMSASGSGCSPRASAAAQRSKRASTSAIVDELPELRVRAVERLVHGVWFLPDPIGDLGHLEPLHVPQVEHLAVALGKVGPQRVEVAVVDAGIWIHGVGRIPPI